MASGISDMDSTMELVMKNIYSSCDIQNTNLIPTSKLIEFIMPYMVEDLSALESLKSSLDPKNEDVCISSEKFYEIMNEWAQKIAGSNEDDEDFLRTPSQLDVIDNKCLPYTQSTPRASFGQKLLRCEGLLNLSNESFYNISASVDTKDNSTVGAEKTMMLEEKIKRLEHQLNKVTGEMDMVKIQLTLTEEQNDQLQSDLERCRTRLSSEQQVNDHLQKSKSCVDDLKEEIRFGKRRIEELNRKLSQHEKDNIHLNNYIQKLEKENTELEEKLEYLVRREQDWKKELFDMKTELDIKDHEIISMTKLNEELKLKLSEKKNQVDQLTNENELLDYKKQGLEKVLSSRRYSSSSQYKTCLEEISSLSNRGTVPIYSPPFNESQLLFSYNSPNFLKKVLSPVTPNLGSPIYPLVNNKERLLRRVLKCSSPIPREIDRSSGFFGAKKSFSLNNLNLSLPNIYCAERSNVVQDQSYEEDFFFESQLPDFRNGPHTSLQAELFQVDYQLDKNLKNGNSHHDDDEMDYSKLQNETVKLKEENDRLHTDLQTSVHKTTELQVKLSHIMFEKRDLEDALKESKIQKKKLEAEISKLKAKIDRSNVNGTDQGGKNKSISELEKELNESINKYESLESEHTSQKEELSKLKSKFNFECAYKTLQTELNERNKELLELRQMNEEYKNMICKLTNSNQELDKSLRRFKMESQDDDTTAFNVAALSENIDETANHVQAHIDTRKTVITELQELNEKLQNELSSKIKEVSQMKDILKSNESIKNKMWRDSKKLENDIRDLKQENQNLHNQLEESESMKKDLKEEWSDIMSKYKGEVAKNGDLLKQISGQKEELSQLLEQLTALKNEVDCIKHVQKEDKEKINQKLSDYENLLKGYETKTKDLRNVNEQLRIELENERRKQLKEDGVSEELFNKLRAFQEMLQNLETKISDLENQNEILRVELESERGKTKKAQDIDSSSDCSSLSFSLGKLSHEPKNRTFEKQKMTIDRLKDKVESLEGKLTSEKSRCDVLKKLLNEKENAETKLREEYDEANNVVTIEKRKLQNTIDELARNMKAQEENYKVICDSSNEKIKEISSKLSEFEENNRKLSLELGEKESQLRTYVKANQNNKKIIDNLNKKLLELDVQQSKASLELAESQSAYANILSDYKTFQQNANDQQFKILQELADRRTAYADILSEYKTFQQKMEDQQSKLLLELSERKNSYADLLSEYKTFQQNTEDQQSKVFLELTEKENAYASLLLEYKTFREKLSKTDDHKEKELMDTEERIKHSRMVLESLDAELEAARERVITSKTEVDCVSERISGLADVVRKCSDELSRAFSRLSEKWDNVFGNDTDYRKLPPMKTCHTLEVEEGILVLNDNIKVTVSLLEMLSAKAPFSMDDPDSQTLHTQQVNSSDSKTVKKFTLRPPRLILRPVSPDSPSLEVDVPPFEPPNQEADIETVNEGCHILSEETYEVTDNVSKKCSSSHLPYLSLDLPFQDAFPHVTDNFLEKLGLHAGSPKQKLSKDETEKLFTTFAIQIALDSRDIKERLYKQKQQCFHQHKKCFYLIKDISMRLRDHRCIGASDPINPVFVLLEDVRFLLQEMVQSAGQLGILTCENRMMKCWNLVTNYMAVIKQNAAKVEQISPNRTREEKLLELQDFSDRNSNPIEEKTDFTKKPKEPLGKTKPTKAKNEEYRRSWFTNFTIAMMWAFIFVFLFLIILISIHWQCKMTTDHQICPLDDFIKKIRVGSPPY